MGGRVQDRVAIVIGAAGGIGAAMAARLVEEGARVVIADTLNTLVERRPIGSAVNPRLSLSAPTSAARPTWTHSRRRRWIGSTESTF